MKSRAAVAFEAGKPLKIVEIDVAPPRKGEVLIRVTHTGLCPWGFSRQEYWSGLLCPLPGDLPKPGIEPGSTPLQMDSLPSEASRKPMDFTPVFFFLIDNLTFSMIMYNFLHFSLKYKMEKVMHTVEN